MSAPKNLCHKCPHFYEDDGDWGCMLFGPEAESCLSLHDDDDLDITEVGCDIGKRKLNFLDHLDGVVGKQHIVRFSHDMKWISWGNMNTCESNCVKYWRPLSKAPEVNR